MSSASSPSHYNLSIGVDGGGSSTDLVLLGFTSAGDILFESTSTCGSTNRNSIGDDAAHRNLMEGLTNLIHNIKGMSTNIDPSTPFTLTSLTFGMSGCNTPSDSVRLTEWSTAHLSSTYSLLQSAPFTLASPESAPSICAFNDSIVALCSGTDGEMDGIVLISGTGMIGWGRRESPNAEPKVTQSSNYREAMLAKATPTEWISGGNGGLFDGGSGFDIGRRVIQLAFEVSDGRVSNGGGGGGGEGEGEEFFSYSSPSHWSDFIASVLAVPTPPGRSMEDIVDYAYGPLEWSKIAKFAPLAFQYAGRIPQCRKIIEEGAQALVHCGTTIMRRLRWERGETLRVVLVGGILETDEMTKLVGEGIVHFGHKRGVQVQILKPKISPAKAAALMGIKRVLKNQK